MVSSMLVNVVRFKKERYNEASSIFDTTSVPLTSQFKLVEIVLKLVR